MSAVPQGEPSNRLSQWCEPIPKGGPITYLWEWAQEIGLGTSVTWQDIKAWSDLTGIIPSRDESVVMTQLSNVWLNERARGQNKDAIAPTEYYEWLASQN